MGQVEQAGEIRVDGFAALDQLGEGSLLAPVTLLALKTRDPVTDSLRAAGCAALGDLGVESRELAVVETDGYLRRHS
jgi:hypothetical protein